MAKNYVLKGKYKDEKIKDGLDCLYFPNVDHGLWITKKRVSSYTLIDKTEKSEYSFWKGMMGMAMYGDGGSVFGIDGEKTTEYMISIEWKDGEKSLILIDEDCYKTFIASMF